MEIYVGPVIWEAQCITLPGARPPFALPPPDSLLLRRPGNFVGHGTERGGVVGLQGLGPVGIFALLSRAEQRETSPG